MGKTIRRKTSLQPASCVVSGHLAAIGVSPLDLRSRRYRERLTVAEASEYLGTGDRFVRRLIARRRITYVKLGKYVRLQRSALDAFIGAGRVGAEAKSGRGGLTCPDQR